MSRPNPVDWWMGRWWTRSWLGWRYSEVRLSVWYAVAGASNGTSPNISMALPAPASAAGVAGSSVRTVS